MPKQKGRPSGLLIHAEAFEAICVARNLLKRQIAEDAGISPTFLADLLAHRGGCAPEKADKLASTLGVKVGALFPERVGWIGPLPDRNNTRPKEVA